MLDQIINYVQSLQNQVEVYAISSKLYIDLLLLLLPFFFLNLYSDFLQFLSMKIASLSPILYDFNLDFDDCIKYPLQVT